jgi:hypothetical protein
VKFLTKKPIMKKVILFFVSLLFLIVNLSATIITVTSSADPGVGSLGEAITNVNNGVAGNAGKCPV